jgi:hypothetical protein
LIALQCWRNAIENFSPIVLLKDLTVSHRCDSVVIKFEPSTGSIRFDASEVMTAVEIPRVNEHTMQLVDPWL